MSERVGQKLRQNREARDITLEQAAQELFIRQRYLAALEAGDLDTLPSRVQARGFLRSYAQFLEMDPEPLLAELEADELGVPVVDAEVGEAAADVRPTGLLEGTPEAIFTQIGQTLKERRELLGLSLDDVEHHTHIRTHYLQALEAGNLDALPSTVQGRGMLNNYAGFLDLETEPLLLRFAEGLQTQFTARQVEQPQAQRRQRRGPRLPFAIRRFISGDLIFVGVLVLGLAWFIVWGLGRVSDIRAGLVPTATSGSFNAGLIPSPEGPVSSTATPTSQGDEPPTGEAGSTEEILLPTLPQVTGPVQVYVVVTQRTWMRVIVDGQVEFEGRASPGSAYTFSGQTKIELLTGNAAALHIYYNQRDLGILGIFGEVVNIVFVVDGVQTPTPRFSPTPTETATPTPGPSETPTVGSP